LSCDLRRRAQRWQAAMDLLSEAVTKIVEHSKLDLGSPDLKLVCLKGKPRRHHVAVLPPANQGRMVDG